MAKLVILGFKGSVTAMMVDIKANKSAHISVFEKTTDFKKNKKAYYASQIKLQI